MCSACTSSSPSAVNSAAEQSARSLMFGLNAARRSTAPISSATPVEAGDEDCSAAGSRSRGAPGRAPARRRGRVRRASPSGTQIVQSGSATTGRARRPPSRSTGRQVARSTGAARRGAGPQRHHLDRRVGAGVAVAALVLGGEVADVAHGELVALARVPAVEPAW